MSYKAAVLKRVNEIKKLTEQHELYVALVPDTFDEHVDTILESTATSQALTSSVDNQKSFSDISPGDVTANGGATNIVHYTCCDKDDIVSSSTAHDSKPCKKSDDSCGVVKLDNMHEQCGSAESTSVSETVGRDRNTEDFVGDDDDDDRWKDEEHNSCEAPNHVMHSCDIDHSPQTSVKSESVAVAVATGKSVSAVLKTSKSVRISDSPPTVSYIDCQCKEVYNGASSKRIVKVSESSCVVCVYLCRTLITWKDSLQVEHKIRSVI